MQPNISIDEKIKMMKKFLTEILEDREILEFRNLSDKKFPQVFFQKRDNKYLFTDSMLGIILIKEDAKLLDLDTTMEVMEELLINNYKINNVNEKLKDGILIRGE